jgi:hypothetical protein
MKTAIYIEDGIVQLVITPESDFEKNAISSFEGKEVKTQIFSGSFYDCRGGWIRQKEYYGRIYGGEDTSDRSIILRVETKKGEA